MSKQERPLEQFISNVVWYVKEYANQTATPTKASPQPSYGHASNILGILNKRKAVLDTRELFEDGLKIYFEHLGEGERDSTFLEVLKPRLVNEFFDRYGLDEVGCRKYNQREVEELVNEALCLAKGNPENVMGAWERFNQKLPQRSIIQKKPEDPLQKHQVK